VARDVCLHAASTTSRQPLEFAEEPRRSAPPNASCGVSPECLPGIIRGNLARDPETLGLSRYEYLQYALYRRHQGATAKGEVFDRGPGSGGERGDRACDCVPARPACYRIP
jgi:hypothetical protein